MMSGNRIGTPQAILVVVFGALLLGSIGAGLALMRGPDQPRDVVWVDLPPIMPERHLGRPGVTGDLTAVRTADLPSVLHTLKRAGISWVRQPFRWAEIEPQPGQLEWTNHDAVVRACETAGVQLLAVLDTSPDWARAQENRMSVLAPPGDLAAFGAFASAVARRFGPNLDSYQIWDEPNIQLHWGSGYSDPTAYMRLLREAAIQIRAVDPGARIVLAGLAPTTESGPLNVDEPDYLEALYDAGAAPYFDVVAAKAYGFWSGPDDRRIDRSVLNFSRLALLRETMLANGDASTPVWAVEIGWNALPDNWGGRVSPWGTDAEDKQASRTIQALDRVRLEWPWLTAVAFAQFAPPADPLDPRAGFALLDRENSARLLLQRLVEDSSADRVAYPGRHAMDDPAVRYDGGWRVTSLGADVRQTGDSLDITFRGSRLDVTVRRGRYWGVLYAEVDGAPANGLPRDGQGQAYLVLHDPLEQTATITMASGLTDGVHRLRLTAEGGWEQWALLGFSVMRERPYAAPSAVSTVALAVGALIGLIGFSLTVWTAPWRAWWRVIRPASQAAFSCLGAGRHSPAQVLLFSALCAAFYLSPSPVLRLALLASIAILASLRPALGLALVLFAAPFYLLNARLPGREIGVAELSLMVSAAAAIARLALDWTGITWWRGIRVRANRMDAAMLPLLIGGVAALFAAENFGVANRELRVVFLEPVAFYLLLRVEPLRREDVWLMVHALILAAVAAAAIGLYQWGFTSDIITAEGVRRVKGMYASPNNLSLVLGRVLALLAGLVVASPGWARRLGYLALAVPIGACLYLTFSRGALLFGLPAAILFVAVVRRGRTLWGVAAALLILAGSLLPIAGTERLRRLLDMQDRTSALRLRLWQGTLNMIREHPLRGIGLDNFLYQYRTRYMLPEAWEEPNLSHPHNVVLDFWTRLGVLGLVVLVVLHWAVFSLGARAYRSLAEGTERALTLGLLTLVVYSLAHGLIDNSLFLVDLSFIFAWTAATIVWLAEREAVSS